MKYLLDTDHISILQWRTGPAFTTLTVRMAPHPRTDLAFSIRLILDSRVLGDQQLNERMKQRFASLADVVNILEETEVEREFLL